MAKDMSVVRRVFGLASLSLWLLTLYFPIVAHYLAKNAYAPADYALVTGLRVLAGACAIPALIFSMSFLHLRDQAIMRAQQAATVADVEATDEA